ncbi:hypothetical protein D1007_52335 [Hordeum vulgare]|nr:hypothetical protein D1007_52335 [Hordeum vulgare]
MGVCSDALGDALGVNCGESGGSSCCVGSFLSTLTPQSLSGVVFGGYMYNLGFVHIIRIRMFQLDQYPGLDDYYEQKHRAVLVERGEVNWRPYTVLRQYPLSNMCLRDQHLWRVRCPMICFYPVELHLPHRVSKQFGVQQRTPPDYVETSVKLHKTNRQSNKTVINWEEHHITWVDMWNAQRQHRVENDETPDTDEVAYLRHLEWMRTEYRVIHKAAWTRSDCLDLLPSEAADAAFNNSIRETVGAHLDYGPLHDRVGTELWRCINESNVVLARAPCPQTDGLVRTTLQV